MALTKIYLNTKNLSITEEDDSGISSFKTGTIDIFKNNHPARLREVILVSKTPSANLNITVEGDEEDTETYSKELANDKIHEERIKIGRGFKNRSFSFLIKNTNGASFVIDSLKVFNELLTKKVR